MNMRHQWNNTDWRKPKNPVPLCLPQIPHEMARNRSRAFTEINGSITEIRVCSGIYYFQFPLQLLILQASPGADSAVLQYGGQTLKLKSNYRQGVVHSSGVLPCTP
jgi:hypothetical protein